MLITAMSNKVIILTVCNIILILSVQINCYCSRLQIYKINQLTRLMKDEIKSAKDGPDWDEPLPDRSREDGVGGGQLQPPQREASWEQGSS